MCSRTPPVYAHIDNNYLESNKKSVPEGEEHKPSHHTVSACSLIPIFASPKCTVAPDIAELTKLCRQPSGSHPSVRNIRDAVITKRLVESNITRG